MTPAIDSRVPVCRIIDGVSRTFRKLPIRTITTLLRKWGEEDRTLLLRDLDAAGADAATKAAKLQEHSDSYKLISRGIRSQFDLERACETILASMRLENPNAAEADVEAIGLTGDELVRLACELWGAKVRDESAGGAADDGSRP